MAPSVWYSENWALVDVTDVMVIELDPEVVGRRTTALVVEAGLVERATETAFEMPQVVVPSPTNPWSQTQVIPWREAWEAH